MMPASNALVDIERRGIQLDMDRWQARFEYAQHVEEKVRRYMLQFVPEAKRDTFSFASPKQVGVWTVEDLGLPVIEETATGQPSSKESVSSSWVRATRQSRRCSNGASGRNT